MQEIVQPSIRDLALIGDKKTCAIVDKKGSIVWYCLWRFDQPSLFSLLVDENGGFWSIETENKEFVRRQFKGDSAILVSEFSVKDGSFTATDFMPFSSEISGICRIFSPAPVPFTVRHIKAASVPGNSDPCKKIKELFVNHKTKQIAWHQHHFCELLVK